MLRYPITSHQINILSSQPLDCMSFIHLLLNYICRILRSIKCYLIFILKWTHPIYIYIKFETHMLNRF
jgi:hypothetical protein